MSTDHSLSVMNQQLPGELATGEIGVTAQQAMATKAIEAAIIIAHKYPRSEETAFGSVMRSCGRLTFAGLARYQFTRGDQRIIGPSVHMARELARCWTNLWYGFDIIHNIEEMMTLRAWTWDLETNTRRFQDASFKKLIYRKRGGWQTPDERDLRELVNKHGEIATRNTVLYIVAPDLIEDAMHACQETIAKDASKDPEEARKRVIIHFGGLGVRVPDLEAYLGHPLSQLQPDEIVDLRAIWKSITDGQSKWADYIAQREEAEPPGAAAAAELLKPKLATEQAPPPTTTAAPTGTPAPAPTIATEPNTATVTSDLGEVTMSLRDEFAACQTLNSVTELESLLLARKTDEATRVEVRAMAEEARGLLRKVKGRK